MYHGFCAGSFFGSNATGLGIGSLAGARIDVSASPRMIRIVRGGGGGGGPLTLATFVSAGTITGAGSLSCSNPRAFMVTGRVLEVRESCGWRSDRCKKPLFL